MTFTFDPKGLVVTAVFLLIFGVTLFVARDAAQGVATAGALSVLAYLLIDLGVTFNPAVWPRQR